MHEHHIKKKISHGNEHDKHHNHVNCDGGHGGHGMSHGSAGMYLKRFWIVTFLLIPLVFTNEMLSGFLGTPTVPFGKWVGFGIATIIFGFSLVFFQHAWHEIKSRKYGMMTLVSLAVASGYLFSVASTFLPSLHAEFYLEISTLIWVLLFGHYLEAKSSSSAGNALQEVAKLLPKQAHKLVNQNEVDVDVETLVVGDIVVVKPGEKIPADGVVVYGHSNVDESLISGESIPVEKKEKAEVVAGSICIDGSIQVKLTRVGENSTVGQIKKLIEQAGKTKPRSQRIADRASAVLTFVAGVTALLTLVVWTFVVGETFVFAITLAITVLVIACPHALGMAIPTVTTIATSLAVKNGFFIKDLSKIEVIRNVDYVVFDKTGTLTEGNFGVTNVVGIGDTDSRLVLKIATSIEQLSSHVIGHSILKYAHTEHVEPFGKIADFQNVAGKGVKAKINDATYFVGSRSLVEHVTNQDDIPTDILGTLVMVSDETKLLGYIVLADSVKPTSIRAVKRLHEMGVKVALLTGDNERIARDVSEELGIDTYFADVLPADKYTYIKKLQDEGNVVLMVGDGVNDAPALTQADAGVAIGAGTDIAVEAGDVVLINDNPEDVAKLITLSRKVYSKMIQNLVWALGYNVVAIPSAAGVFAYFGFFLRPEVGALVMSLSTVIVVVNALTLKKVSL